MDALVWVLPVLPVIITVNNSRTLIICWTSFQCCVCKNSFSPLSKVTRWTQVLSGPFHRHDCWDAQRQSHLSRSTSRQIGAGLASTCLWAQNLFHNTWHVSYIILSGLWDCFFTDILLLATSPYKHIFLTIVPILFSRRKLFAFSDFWCKRGREMNSLPFIFPKGLHCVVYKDAFYLIQNI